MVSGRSLGPTASTRGRRALAPPCPGACRLVGGPARRLSAASRHVAAAAIATNRDMTSDVLARAFSLALTTRLKQWQSIDVDVRSTAFGLLEGRLAALTVKGQRWRTPLELTAEQLLVDIGEMVLDGQKLVWQQTVALRNVPQGIVAFTLTSADLQNFMVHPIMKVAAAKAIQGHAFAFDRTTAAVRLDPATGRGLVSYEGVYAGNGNRYSVVMITPPPPPPPGGAALRTSSAASGSAAAARGAGAGPLAGRATASVGQSNTLEQLTVVARRITAAGPRDTTGSFASVSSMDGPLDAAAAAQVAAALAAAAAAPPASAPPPRGGAAAASPFGGAAAAAGAAGAAGGLSGASGGSMDEAATRAVGEADEVLVGEGLRRFFSSLVINLQGIELRQPTLLVQLPGSGGAAGLRTPMLPPRAAAPGAAGAAAAAAAAPGGGPVPALLTITMAVAINQLPPLNMKF